MKVQLNARNCAHHFDAGAADPILYAGLSAAVGLPYECGTGTCGTCKARLVSGELHDRWPEAPGRRYLKTPADFLMCQCTPKSDVVAELASFVHTMDAGACVPAKLWARVKSLKRLTHDVMLIDTVLSQAMPFDAGQYALVRAPGVPGFRAWSMVNYERGAKTAQFVVKKKPGGGISEWLFGAGRLEGEELEVFGPLGSATFHPSLGKHLLCIAGGSGIAGMMAILARANQEGYFTQFDGNVFFGVRTLRDAFFLDELAGFCRAAGPRLKVTIALSDEEVNGAASAAHQALTFARGMVHEVAKAAMAGRYANTRAFLAGPPPAVDAAIRVLLMEAKLTADNIRYDKFS